MNKITIINKIVFVVVFVILAGGFVNVQKSHAATITAISTGDMHTCALFSNGIVNCWGYNGQGGTGNGNTTTPQLTPVAVTGITTATAISLGHGSSCALLADHTVKCWGYNGWGQLGNGSTYSSSTPVSVTGISTAIAISVGEYHACAILSDNTVKCWGANYDGQLGNGSTTYSSTPVSVSGISTAIGIYGGIDLTCAILSDNTVKCWGVNTSGQTGNGSTSTPRLTPVSVVGISTATSIAMGNGHACALLLDNTVKCWGDNSAGETGNGNTTTPQLTPVATVGIATATAIAAGEGLTCARLSDSTVKCWGYNLMGGTGNGNTTSPQLTPVAASGITTATTVSLTLYHACALLSDSTVKCWGWNADGEIGNGNTTSPQTTPVFALLPSAPTVTTSAASGTTTTSSILNSTVNPNGDATNISYLWGTQSGVACNLQPNTLAGPTGKTGTSALSGANTQATLPGLLGNTTYYFCVMATNNYGTTYGTVSNFTTSATSGAYKYMDAGSIVGGSTTDCDDTGAVPCPPTISSVGSATQTSLTVNWTPNTTAGPAQTSFNLFYCDRTASGVCSPSSQIGGSITSGTTSYPHNATITCGRTYAYLIQAVNATGTSADSNVVATATSACASAPTLNTPTSSSVTYNSAVLGANVASDGGASITARGICWSTGTTAPSLVNGATCSSTAGTTGTYSYTVSSLPSSSRVYYQGYATNNAALTGYTTGTNFVDTPAACTNGYQDFDKDGYGTGVFGCYAASGSYNVVGDNTDCLDSGTTAEGLAAAQAHVNTTAYVNNDNDSSGTSGTISQGLITNASTNAGTSIVITKPADIVQGMFMMVGVEYTLGTSRTVTMDATGGAWTAIGTSNSTTVVGIQMFYKYASASEPATYTITLGGTANDAHAWMSSFANVATSSPIGTVVAGSGASASQVGATLTPTTSNYLLVLGLGSTTDAGSYTIPAGMSQFYGKKVTSVDSTGAFTELRAVGTATGTRTSTFSSSATYASLMVEIKRPTVISGTICMTPGVPSGWSTGNTDCDDLTSSYYRNLSTGYPDKDGDGVASSSTGSMCSGASLRTGVSASVGTDCNDADPALYQNITGYNDLDNDTYTLGSGAVCSGAALPTGYRASASGTADCYDGNANAFPGQTTYYPSPRGDSSYDYNCDTLQTKEVVDWCTSGTGRQTYFVPSATCTVYGFLNDCPTRSLQVSPTACGGGIAVYANGMNHYIDVNCFMPADYQTAHTTACN